MKKTICIITTVVILILSLASCAPVENTTPLPTTTPGVSGIESIADANTAFALDLYRLLRAEDGNLFYSPYSISTALAMTSAGAKSSTLEQMLSVLKLTGTADRYHELISQLDTLLKSRSQNIEVVTGSGADGTKKDVVDGFTLNIINALWGQQDYGLLNEFLDLIEQYYGGGLHELDFIGHTEESRLAINKWASEQTEGRIKDLLAPGDIHELTRLVLTNAIYFNAQWQTQFSEDATYSAPFYLLDESTVTAPMMHKITDYKYAETDGCRALSLPYLGGDLDMVVLLPDEGSFEGFENSLDIQTLQGILAKMEKQSVSVHLPKFEFEAEYKLKQTLIALGMTDAFNTDADFSGINGKDELYIDDVIHKSFVAVDEYGTEAAAVTAVMMVLKAAGPAEVAEFRADRPFIFLIRDIQTGSILFMGRVMNPVA